MAIIERYVGNPILTKDDVPYPVETVHNAGVTKHSERYVMLFRAHLRNGRSIIGKAESYDGFSFEVSPQPFLTPSDEAVFAEYEEYGVEDPRISQIDDQYLITYSAYSRHGVRICNPLSVGCPCLPSYEPYDEPNDRLRHYGWFCAVGRIELQQQHKNDGRAAAAEGNPNATFQFLQ